MTRQTNEFHELADRILERMRGGPILAVSPERSKTILVEELRQLCAAERGARIRLDNRVRWLLTRIRAEEGGVSKNLEEAARLAEEALMLSDKEPTPTRLLELLFSDPATDAWEADAQHGLRPKQAEPMLELIQRLVGVAATEADDVSQGMSLEGVDEADDLRDIATTCKRCALLLLHAAHAAEAAATKGGE